MEKQPATYILASARNGTLYVGVTGSLVGRIWQHREHVVDGFTKKYDVGTLVWYELHGTMDAAITREKQIKKWNRAWKIRLIEEQNPTGTIFGSGSPGKGGKLEVAGLTSDAAVEKRLPLSRE